MLFARLSDPTPRPGILINMPKFCPTQFNMVKQERKKRLLAFAAQLFAKKNRGKNTSMLPTKVTDILGNFKNYKD